MLFTTHLGADRAGLPSFTVPAPAPTPAPTKPSPFAPTAPAASAPKTSAFVPVTIVPQFSRAAAGYMAADAATHGVFRAVQALIELVAQRKGWNVNSTWWRPTPQTGFIDAQTAANYLIIVNSGAPFGPLLDTRVDPLMVATQATLLANTMARWLGIPVPLPAAVAPQGGKPVPGTGVQPGGQPAPGTGMQPGGQPGRQPGVTVPTVVVYPPGTVTANIDGQWHLAAPIPGGAPAEGVRVPGQAYAVPPAWRELGIETSRPTSDRVQEVSVKQYLHMIRGYAICADGSMQASLAACPAPAPVPVPTPVPVPVPTPVPVIAPPTPPQPASPAPSAQSDVALTVPGASTSPALPTAMAPSAELPPPVVRAKYRVGCVARFNRTRKIYSIYCPVSTALGYSYVEHLAEQLLTPSAEPPPAGTVKEGEEATPPTCETEGGGTAPCPQTGDDERDKGFFRLHNPWMWLSLAGVVGVVGGTGYVVYRRRRQG